MIDNSVTLQLLDDQTVEPTAPPGDILQDTLEMIGMSQAELAQRMGRPTKTINGIIKNRVAITFETALQLERVLGIPANFWNQQEQSYRETLARQEEQKFLESQVEWLHRLPLETMTRLGWLPLIEEPVEQLRAALQFFGVASPAQWRELWVEGANAPLHKIDSEKQQGTTAAWLRQGELLAQRLTTAPYEARAFREALTRLRNLTTEPPQSWLPTLTDVGAANGVAVIVVPPLPEMPLVGATRWLTPTKALLQLSPVHTTDDQLWSAFFHQAGHLLLHGKREVFLEGPAAAESAKEDEADSFAADLLIPPRLLGRFLEQHTYRTKTAIQDFAQQIGLAPGLVVRRLHQEGYLPPDYYNELKRKVEIGD